MRISFGFAVRVAPKQQSLISSDTDRKDLFTILRLRRAALLVLAGLVLVLVLVLVLLAHQTQCPQLPAPPTLRWSHAC
jgi:hypothetical protein